HGEAVVGAPVQRAMRPGRVELRAENRRVDAPADERRGEAGGIDLGAGSVAGQVIVDRMQDAEPPRHGRRGSEYRIMSGWEPARGSSVAQLWTGRAGGTGMLQAWHRTCYTAVFVRLA